MKYMISEKPINTDQPTAILQYLVHLDFKTRNTALRMGYFFTILILEIGVFFMVKNPLKSIDQYNIT